MDAPLTPARTPLPTLGTELSLRVAGAGEHRVTVARVEQGRLQLELIAVDGEHSCRDGGASEITTTVPADAFVEYAAGEGICQLPGTIELDPEGHPLRGRFVHDGVAELLQRRAFVRAPLALEVTLVSAERGGLATQLSTIDVSGGGLLVVEYSRAEMGELMDFTLVMDPGPPVLGQCRVVRRTPAGHVGLQIVAISDADRDRLVHRVFRRQRELRTAG